MNLRRRSRLTLALMATAGLLPAGAFADGRAHNAHGTAIATYREHVPLGIAGFFTRPARRSFYVISTARSAQFQDWKLKSRGGTRYVEGPDGSIIRQYPHNLSFRVTATAMLPELMDVDREMLDNVSDMNALLLQLGFRLKIFHGLEVTTVNPQAVDMIGMPADVPYDERIYRLSFVLPREVPIEDRIVLEVLSPAGGRLCKFHLEF
ncbi:MAG: hypothetical protein ACE14L_14495 [Terriglobales bacterium]